MAHEQLGHRRISVCCRGGGRMDLLSRFKLHKMRLRHEPFLNSFIVSFPGEYRPRRINRTGVLVLKLLNEGLTVGQVVGQVARAFSQSFDAVLRDTHAFLLTLLQMGAITERPPGDTSRHLYSNFAEQAVEALYNCFYIPDRVQIAVTTDCNLNCRHCYLPGTDHVPGLLSLDDFERIIDLLDEWGIHVIQIAGGEPFVHPEIRRMIEYAAERYFSLEVFTNGTLLEEWLDKRLVDQVAQFVISIDGPEEYHDTFRGRKGAFERTMRGIRLVKQLGGRVRVSYSLNLENATYVEEVKNRVAGTGADSFVCAPPVPVGNAERFRYTVSEYRELIAISRRVCLGANRNGSNSLEGQEYAGLPREFSCAAGKTLLYISPDGGVYPCPLFSYAPFRVGHVLLDDVRELWRSSAVLAQFRSARAPDDGPCSECKACPVWCRALKYHVTGEIQGVPEYCDRLDNTW